jgi:hypothetical protein
MFTHFGHLSHTKTGHQDALIRTVSASLRQDNGLSGRLPLAPLADGVCFGASIGKLLSSTAPVQLRVSPVPCITCRLTIENKLLALLLKRESVSLRA